MTSILSPTDPFFQGAYLPARQYAFKFWFPQNSASFKFPFAARDPLMVPLVAESNLLHSAKVGDLVTQPYDAFDIPKPLIYRCFVL